MYAIRSYYEKQVEGYKCHILSDNTRQFARLHAIFEDRGLDINFKEVNHSLHEGFIVV